MSSNPKCWANPLGDCSDKLSGEHIVSQSIFDSEQLTVMGLPWCRNAPKTIGLSSLTANILCRKHNSELSELDLTAGKAIQVLCDAFKLSELRSHYKRGMWRVVQYKINGAKLERWFLKTLINVAYESELHIGIGAHPLGHPSKRLVEIVFGKSSFIAYEGLYTVIRVGKLITPAENFQLLTLMNKEAYLFGGMFLFRGFRFLLSLSVDRIEKLPIGIGLPGEDWSDARYNFHNQFMRDKVGKYLSQVIEVSW